MGNCCVHLLCGWPNAGVQTWAFLCKLRGEAAVRNDQIPLATKNEYRRVAAETAQVTHVHGGGNQERVEIV
jgi:hypothetical protein